MLKKLLVVLVFTLITSGTTVAAEKYKPYQEQHVNFLYNLLFCDDLSLFNKPKNGERGIWNTLLSDQPNFVELRKVADDETNEGRMRAIAYNRLRQAGKEVPEKIVLGVIVEVPLDQGLDVMAVFSEGGIRYLNQTESVAIFEGEGHVLEDFAKELISIAQPAVNLTGPWKKERLPPPMLGNVRLTFLVSDGLYFGEGEFGEMYQDPLSGPIISKARELLIRMTEIRDQQNE